MNLHLTYFGDNNFSIGKNIIRHQAENFEVFETIQEFGESNLEDDMFWEKVDSQLNKSNPEFGILMAKNIQSGQLVIDRLILQNVKYDRKNMQTLGLV